MAEKLDFLKSLITSLPEPEDLFRGTMLPENFELPDSILFFYHDFCAPAANAHRRYTLVFPLENMRYFVDQREYDISEGDVLLIRPYSLRFLSPQSASYKRLFITFQLKSDQSYLPESVLLHLSEASLEHLERLLELFEAGESAELSCGLFALLQSLEAGTGQVGKRRMSSEIARAAAFINENLHTTLDNHLIAGKVNMSVSNLSRRFRKETGLSVHSYIEQQRLDLACYYLQKTLLRVDEIARKCGFASTSSFSHFFRNRMAAAPLSYRRKMLK